MIPIKIPSDLVEGSECLECEIPWVTEGAIYKMDDLLNIEDVVLEFGVGGSTLFFARRCKKVDSIETNLDWFEKVLAEIDKKNIGNAHVACIESENSILDAIAISDISLISVLSIDTQGGYNRSAILNAFLEKGISHNLRMIILDNYAHEGLFPEHWNNFDCGFHDWTVMTFDHPRWAGSGTKILLKR